MKSRKLAMLASGLAFMFALTSCAGDVNGGGPAPTDSSSTGGAVDDAAPSGPLRILSFSTDETPMNEAVEAFKAAYPDVQVDLSFGEVADIQALLTTQLAANSGPDVFAVYPGAGTANSIQILARNDYLVDLSDREFASRVVEGERSLLGLDGKLFGAPMTAIGIGYLYNETAMDEIGLVPPLRWGEVLPFCKAARDAGKVAYAAPWQTPWTTIQMPYALTATLLYKDNPNFAYDMLDGTATFAGSAWEEALDKQYAMEAAGCFNSRPNGTAKDVTDAAIAAGDTLGFVVVQSVLPALLALAPEGTKFNLAPVPATNNANETWMASGTLRGLGVNSSSKNLPAALAFIDFMTTPEVMGQFAATSGAIPALPVDAFEPNAVQAVVLEFRAANRTVPLVDQLWPNARVQQNLIAGIQAQFSRELDAAGITASMDDAFSQGR